MESIEYLNAGDAILSSEKKWCKDHFEKGFFRKSYCALGAISKGHYLATLGIGILPAVDAGYSEAVWQLDQSVRELTNGKHNNIVTFNDARETTFEQLKEVFQMAKIKAWTAALLRDTRAEDFPEDHANPCAELTPIQGLA